MEINEIDEIDEINETNENGGGKRRKWSNGVKEYWSSGVFQPSAFLAFLAFSPPGGRERNKQDRRDKGYLE
jgi:hypothetical protein